MSSQHSDDQTARSRPLTARQSRCRSPFTRAGSRLSPHCTRIPIGHDWSHHYPTTHDPHALQEGRGLRSSRGRLRAARRNTTGKSAPPRLCPFRRLKFPIPASPPPNSLRETDSGVVFKSFAEATYFLGSRCCNTPVTPAILRCVARTHQPAKMRRHPAQREV
jgi:hypothetical protein